MTDDPVQHALDRMTGSDEVNWEALTAEASSPEARQVVHALKDIAAIARAHSPATGKQQPVPFSWGPLQVHEFIARGAHGDVYRAWDPRLEREVALKLLRSGRADGLEAPFAIAEGRLLARVRHPNVVTVFGADRIDDQAGIWMEFVRGCTLSAVVEEQGPLPLAESVQVGLAVCDGLKAIHDAGLVHRDVKAQNVVCGSEGRIILMDLSAGFEASTPDGRLEGTPLYLAPELLDGAQATVASDVYAVGVLLFFLITGRYPTTSLSVDELRKSHTANSCARLADEAGVPRAFGLAVDRALARKPEDRYANIDEFRQALSAIVTVGPRAPAVRSWWKRGVVMLVALLAGGLLWSATRRDLPSQLEFAERDWVLIAPFENRTNDPRFDGTLETALGQELSASTLVNVVPEERIHDSLRLMRRDPTLPLDLSTARQVAVRDGRIRVLVTGRITRDGGEYTTTIRIVDPSSGATLATSSRTAGEDGIYSAIGDLAVWVRSSLGDSRANAERPQLVKATTPSLEALRLYTEALAAARGYRWPAVEAGMSAALVLDPGFASAQVWLAWALTNLQRHDAARAAAHRAWELADTTTTRERYFIRASYFILHNEQDRAVGELEALVREYPDDYWGVYKLGREYISAGRTDDFLDVAQRMAVIRPADVATQVQLVLAVMLHHGASAAMPQATKARELVAALPAEAMGTLEAGYLQLFPVHHAWAEGRITEALRILDGVDAAVPSGEPDWQRARRANFRMTFGQLRRAEEIADTIRNPALRLLTRAFVAFARQDPVKLRILDDYDGYDLTSVSLLLRVGDQPAAERMLKRMPAISSRHTAWTTAEVRVARGETAEAVDELRQGLDVLTRIAGARAFFYTETLADALVVAGRREAAIRELRAVSRTRDRLFHGVDVGHLWLRTQHKLAELLREAGRVQEAREIEADLRRLLVAADDDHPLLIELRRRARE